MSVRDAGMIPALRSALLRRNAFDPQPLSRLASVAMVLLAIYCMATSIWEAAHRPFWYDEVFTVVLSRLPSLHDINAALARAADTPGTGYYVIQRAVVPLVENELIAQRLASVVAASCVSLFLFLFARGDVGVLAASAGAMVPLFSHLFHGYSVEARPYALMLCLVSLAALAWRRSDCGRWNIVLGLALAVAIWVHYYSVFVLLPFALAEVVHTWQTRRRRSGVWYGLAFSIIPLAASWTTLIGLRNYYGPHYWSRPTLGQMITTYDRVLSIGEAGMGFGVAAIIGLVLLGLLVKRLIAIRRHTGGEPPAGPIVLTLCLMGLPFVAGTVSLVMGGGYTERYVLGVVSGISLGVAYLLPEMGRRGTGVVLACMIGAFSAHEAMFWARGGVDTRLGSPALEAQQQVFAKAAATGLPVVVSNGQDFLPLAFSLVGNPDLNPISLVDADAARHHIGTDSIDLDLAILRDYLPVPVVEFQTFVTEHSRFVLLSSPGLGDWWPRRLLDDGYTLDVMLKQGAHTLYVVTK